MPCSVCVIHMDTGLGVFYKQGFMSTDTVRFMCAIGGKHNELKALIVVFFFLLLCLIIIIMQDCSHTFNTNGVLGVFCKVRLASSPNHSVCNLWVCVFSAHSFFVMCTCHTSPKGPS